MCFSVLAAHVSRSRFRGIAPGSTLPARVVETEIEPLRLYSDSGELDQVYFQCRGSSAEVLLAKEVIVK